MGLFRKLMLVIALAGVSARGGVACAADPSASGPVESIPAEPANAYSPQWPEPPDTGAMLLRLCVGTVVVLALCVGSLYFAKPWLQKLQTTGTGVRSLHVEASIPLGNRAVLYLVKIGDVQLVAGTDGTGLKSLITLPVSFKDVLDESAPAMDVATLPPAFGLNLTPPDTRERAA